MFCTMPIYATLAKHCCLFPRLVVMLMRYTSISVNGVTIICNARRQCVRRVEADTSSYRDHRRASLYMLLILPTLTAETRSNQLEPALYKTQANNVRYISGCACSRSWSYGLYFLGGRDRLRRLPTTPYWQYYAVVG